MTTYTREDFAVALLQKSGGKWPVNQENVDALVAQQVAENTTAVFNPSATTEDEPGDTNFNSADVKDYPSFDEGVSATYATLTNGKYVDITDALERGNSAANVETAWSHSEWGTEPFSSDLTAVQRARDAFYTQLISGTDDGEDPDVSLVTSGPTDTAGDSEAEEDNVAAAAFALQTALTKIGALPTETAALKDDLVAAIYSTTTALDKLNAALEAVA